MAYDLGALVTRLVVDGQQQFDRAIDSAGSKLKGAAGSANQFGGSLASSSARTVTFGAMVRQAGTELTYLSATGQAALTSIGTGLTVAGAAVAAMVGLSIAKYSDYEAALSEAKAVTGAYGEELAKVRELTIQLGGDTVFTAREAAEGVTNLGKAGISTADILGGALAGSLNLAAAGTLGVGQAAEITAVTMTQFGLRGTDAVHVSDLLAASAGKAQGEVTDMALALRQSGLVANQFGLSVEETVGTLAAFASAGLIGSDAGTSFRTMLLSLATPTTQQRDLLKQYNIQAYDAQGNFVGLTSLAGQLQEGFKGATQEQRDFALGIIFGSDAIRAANVLYNQGTAGIQEWEAAANDAGYAARFAAEMQNNLRGDLEKLGGAFDSALIKTGSAADGVLRDMVQTITELVDGYANLDPWVQQTVLTGAALLAGVLLLGGGFLIAIPKILAFRAALMTLRTEMPTTVAALGRVTAFLTGPWGIALAAAALGGKVLIDWMNSAKSTGEQLQASLIGAKNASDILATAGKGMEWTAWADVTAQLQDLDAVLDANAHKWDNLFTIFDSTYFGAYDALRSVGTELAGLTDTNLPAAQQAFNLLAAETDGSREKLLQLLEMMPDYKQALIEHATEQGIYSETMSETTKQTVLLDEAQGLSAASAAANQEALAELSGQASVSGEDMSELADIIRDLASGNLSARSAARDLEAAIDSASRTIKDNSKTLDINKKAGRENEAALDAIAEAALDASAAVIEQGGSQEDAAKKIDRGRDALIKQLEKLGIVGDEAEAYADSLGLIPENIKQVVELSGINAAQRSVDNFISRNNGRNINIDVITNQANGGILGYAQGAVRHAADGWNAPRMSSQAPQMRAAGSYVVWAEDETDGESFIPHALSKRARSERLMAATAAILGGMYVPASALRRAADGLIETPGSVDATVGARREVNVGGIHLYNPVVRDIQTEAREAAQLVKAALSV